MRGSVWFREVCSVTTVSTDFNLRQSQHDWTGPRSRLFLLILPWKVVPVTYASRMNEFDDCGSAIWKQSISCRLFDQFVGNYYSSTGRRFHLSNFVSSFNLFTHMFLIIHSKFHFTTKQNDSTRTSFIIQ